MIRTNYFPLTANSVKWIEDFLFDRFEVKLNIYKNIGHIELSIDGSETKLVFIDNTPFFYYSNVDVPCTLWDSKLEKFDSLFENILPVPGLVSIKSPLKNIDNGNIIFEFNIIGFIYWILARIEELDLNNLDAHGRFASFKSHASKFNYLFRPILDEWLYIFKQLIEEVWPNLKCSFCREPKKIISCDVDLPFEIELYPPRFLKSALSQFARNKSISEIHEIVCNYIKISLGYTKNDLNYNGIRWIMDINEKFNNKVIFYFLSGSSHSLDPRYSLKNKSIKNIIKEILNRGHEVGLHPSYMSYNDERLLIKEVELFKYFFNSIRVDLNYVKSRQHFLRWRSGCTDLLLDEAGINNDSTLGYADSIGYRCGTSHTFKMYNAVHDKILKLTQTPLLFMETSIFDNRYMNLSYCESTLDFINDYKKSIFKTGGSFNLLWHNSSFNNDLEKDFYSEIIK